MSLDKILSEVSLSFDVQERSHFETLLFLNKVFFPFELEDRESSR